MTDIIRQGVHGWKIVGVDKGLGIKITGSLAVPPEDRNGMHRHRVVHLFRRPAQPLFVLKGDGETVWPQKFKFRGMTGRGEKTGVVETTAGGVHSPPPVQGVEKFRPFGHGAVHVTGEQSAKPGLGGANLVPVFSAPDQGLGGAVKGKNGHVQLPRIRRPDWQDGIVTLLPVRRIGLVVNIDFDTIVKTMTVAGESVDQEIRPIVPSNPVFGLQDRQEKILKLGWTVREVE